ncbi:MAG: CBS domain-containing protein [Pleurocapsa sp.]
MKASEIMTTKVVTIHSLATVADAIAMMQERKVRSLIVEPSNNDEAYGILTETDIVYKVTAKEKQPEAVMVYQIMTKPCIVVNPDLSLENVARLFAETGIQRAPVIQGQLLGMISITDLIMKLEVKQKLQRDRLSAKIHEALLHSRVGFNPQEQIDQECEVAWDVVEEIQKDEG